MKVGFLYNHEALHQVSHTAPVAAELSGRDGVEVTALVSSAAQEERFRALVGPAAKAIRIERLRIGRAARLLDAGLRWVAPFRRVAMLRQNLARFAALDVLVVPETTSLLLRDRFGLGDLKFVWIPHGAGDRSVGFRAVARGFDLVLLSGPKVRDRMLGAGIVVPERQVMIGYPKFDTINPARPLPSHFSDGPTVLYNPHFDPRLSSWYAMGEQVLDWFAGQRRFNLIFAPHVMLFRRRLHASVEHRQMRWRRTIAARFSDAPNLLIDPGSTRSVDMSYTRAADIYLGDASSQIYEWIARPRPAIFLNSADIAWQGNPDFSHWRLGEVVTSLAALPAALDRAATPPDPFADRQRAAFQETFGPLDGQAARRAADAILGRFGG